MTEHLTNYELGALNARAYEQGRLDERKVRDDRASNWRLWFFAALTVLIVHVLFGWGC